MARAELEGADRIGAKPAMPLNELQGKLALPQAGILEWGPLVHPRGNQRQPPKMLLALAIDGVSQPSRSIAHWPIVAIKEKAIQATR